MEYTFYLFELIDELHEEEGIERGGSRLLTERPNLFTEEDLQLVLRYLLGNEPFSVIERHLQQRIKKEKFYPEALQRMFPRMIERLEGMFNEYIPSTLFTQYLSILHFENLKLVLFLKEDAL